MSLQGLRVHIRGALLVSCFVLGLGATCDRFVGVGARLPLVAPVDTACLHSTLARSAPHRKVGREAVKRDGQLLAIGYGTRDSDSKNVSEVVRLDSSAYLVSGYGRVNAGFVREEQDSIGFALGAFLLGVRDSCGGRSPRGSRTFTVQGNDPLYEAWPAPGTNRRVSLQWTIDHYLLQLDTLAERPDPRYTPWVRAALVKIARPPKGFAIATECARDDSLLPGSVVAIVPATDNGFSADVLQAWDVDLTTLRITPGRTEGVQCGRGDTPVPTATRAVRAAALSFSPPPGRARIYVYQPGRTFEFRSIVTVVIDGQIVGWTDGGTYLMVDVEPGPHRVSSLKGDVVALDAREDSAYYVKVWWKKFTWTARTGVRAIHPFEARAAILTGRPVPGSWPGRPMRNPP